MIVTKLMASLLALFGLMTFFSPLGRILNFLTFFLIIMAIWQKNFSRIITISVLVCLTLQIFLWGQINGGQIRNQLASPLGDSFTTDMCGFLKAYQLMKGGQEFYVAFQKGMSIAMHTNFTVDIGGWREPFIFWFWTILPGNGTSIYYLFEIFVAGSLITSYLIGKKFLPNNLALLSPFILVPYFHYPLVDLTLLQPEWWGMFFLIFGLAAYLYRHLLLAGLFFFLALLTRELFLLPIMFFLMISFFALSKKDVLKLAIPLTLFPIFYFSIHLPKVLSLGAGLLRGFGARNILALYSTLAYSSWNYLLGVWRPFWILIIFACSNVLYLFYKRRFSWNRLVVFSSWFLYFVLTIFMAVRGGIDVWHDYWGIYFVPLLLISAPILILPPGK